MQPLDSRIWQTFVSVPKWIGILSLPILKSDPNIMIMYIPRQVHILVIKKVKLYNNEKGIVMMTTRIWLSVQFLLPTETNS